MYDVPTQGRQERINEYARKFEMEDALGSRIQSYSHGMRQKIMVMGALMHQPPVWILDEPLTGLDPKSAFALKEMMKEQMCIRDRFGVMTILFCLAYCVAACILIYRLAPKTFRLR